MAEHTTHRCLVSPDDMLAYLTFEADCVVGLVERHATFVDGAAMRAGDRVISVNGEEVADRCELRTVLADLVQSVPADVIFQREASAFCLASGVTDAAAAPPPMGADPEAEAAQRYLDVTMNDSLACSVPAVPNPAALAEHGIEGAAAAAGISTSAADALRGELSPARTPRRSPAMSPARSPARSPNQQSLMTTLLDVKSPRHALLANSLLGGSVMAGSLRGHDFETTNTLLSLAAPPTDAFNKAEGTLQHKLAKAVDGVVPTSAVLILSDKLFSPLEEIEVLCRTRSRPPPVQVDFGLRIRLRIAPEALVEALRKAATEGHWLVVIRGAKSMMLLNTLADAVKELREAPEGVSPNFRLIVSTEPHPHFPEALMKGSKSIRPRANFSQSALVFESIGTSVSIRRATTDASAEDAAASAEGKRVRMASVVSVVDIEPREVHTTPAAARPAPRVNVSGTVTLTGSFTALPGDKFYGIAFAGQRDRVAIGSSLGNAYIVDMQGASLASFHLHEAAIWDLTFSSPSTFLTGGEDRIACEWQRDEHEVDAVTCKSTMRCANDVYAIGQPGDNSAYVVGGLMPAVYVRTVGSEKSIAIPMNTSSQAIVGFGNDAKVATAGGDGSVSLIDCERCAVYRTMQQHAKKAACATSLGAVVVSGSYDGKIRLWDTRSPSQNQNLQCLKFSQYVTGLAAEGNYLAASVGTSLYLWDVRNLTQVLGGHPRAWRDISRAMCIDAESRTVVTASPDGVARFWSF